MILKQAPRCWFNKLNEVLNKIGFLPTVKDQCIFVKRIEDRMIMVLTYVDDLLIAAVDSEDLENVKIGLMS